MWVFKWNIAVGTEEKAAWMGGRDKGDRYSLKR